MSEKCLKCKYDKSSKEHYFSLGVISGIIVLALLILFLSSTTNDSEEIQEIGVPTIEEPCVYKNSEFYYKGYCGAITEYLELAETRDDLNREWVELEKEKKEFMRDVLNNDDVERVCSEWQEKRWIEILSDRTGVT